MLRGLSPEQNEGLLGMAAQMLQAGGPQRMPVSFGQGLGAGLQGFSQGKSEAERRKQEQEQAAQIAEMRGLQIQNSRSEMAAQEAAQRQAAALAQFNQQYHARGQGGGASPPLQPESLPKLGAQPQMSVPGQQVPAQESAPQGGLGGIFTERMQYAQAARAAGYEGAAKAAMEEALKFMPEVKEYKNVYGPDGKVYSKPYFKDGSSGAPIPAEVAEKLTEVNTGGGVDLVNPFTAKTVRSLKKTMTPGEAASNALGWANNRIAGQRLDIDRQEAATRAAVVKAPTEFQGKSAAFGARAAEADKILSGLTGQYSPGRVNAKMSAQDLPLVGGISGAVANSLLSDTDQQAEQAQRDFINAVLRQESGAAIGESEFLNARRQYFPQPGDSAATIAQKQKNRALAVQGLNNNAGRAAFTPAAAPAGGGVKFLGFE
ncbi:hypothetical protein OU994_18020 [Pseudoduganella sp. SL102]|uniref:hypothetical protein n=1 Tax=Pseudoduganella sp. SL102 TaxID=2995154 RepID=UPI00248BB65F|nr:hypothetical protein [Pseudoduganella sp. SL102]WBS00218.1 hypothetical protein OU994_18020 [Pseudoduganella sp. SL102]